MPDIGTTHGKTRIALATEHDRETIYRLRHAVYARELGQHPENPEGELRDSLDAFNEYITASVNGEMSGFISITPPGEASYSIDKYLSRDELPFAVDDGLYELRLLTVTEPYRGHQIAPLLMYAAFRWVEESGGTRLVAIGRVEVLDLYLKVGLQPMGRRLQSGAVTYELLSATTSEVRNRIARYGRTQRRLEAGADWRLGIPFRKSTVCFHGGAFFEAVGPDFAALARSKDVINADVLDAWFPPSPKVVEALQEYHPWLLRTSPPTWCEGLVDTLASARGVDRDCVLPGGGSSSLLFMAFRHWLTPDSRVLLLDPTYGEYAHVLEHVIGCEVDRLALSLADGYTLDPDRLVASTKAEHDMVVLVNPNNPTGRHVPRPALEGAIARLPKRTLVWVDEAYVDYVDPDESLERFAARSENVVVCKSMSKAYALSGARVGYLCGPKGLLADLKAITPPWSVGLPAQVAAVRALQDPDYYAQRYAETRALRAELSDRLLAAGGMEVVPGVANFLLCHLAQDGPTTAEAVEQCRAENLFLRDAGTMGSQMGTRALRIAVKDAETNRRIVETLEGVLAGRGCVPQPDWTEEVQ